MLKKIATIFAVIAIFVASFAMSIYHIHSHSKPKMHKDILGC